MTVLSLFINSIIRVFFIYFSFHLNCLRASDCTYNELSKWFPLKRGALSGSLAIVHSTWLPTVFTTCRYELSEGNAKPRS